MKKLLSMLICLCISLSTLSSKEKLKTFENIKINISSKVLVFKGEPGIRVIADSTVQKYINYTIDDDSTMSIKAVPGFEHCLKDNRIKIIISTPKDGAVIEPGIGYRIQKTKSGNHSKK